MTIIVNLFGGPGTGKSTTAAGVFSKLKLKGVETELVTEFAKDKVWEESLRVLENQFYITAKQHHRVFRLLDKVDVIVTDSPFILGIIYQRGRNEHYETFVLSEYKKMDTMNVFLDRVKPYHPKGRTQTEEQAKEIDVKVKNMLDVNKIEYLHMPADEAAIDNIVNIVRHQLEKENV